MHSVWFWFLFSNAGLKAEQESSALGSMLMGVECSPGLWCGSLGGCGCGGSAQGLTGSSSSGAGASGSSDCSLGKTTRLDRGECALYYSLRNLVQDGVVLTVKIVCVDSLETESVSLP